MSLVQILIESRYSPSVCVGLLLESQRQPISSLGPPTKQTPEAKMCPQHIYGKEQHWVTHTWCQTG